MVTTHVVQDQLMNVHVFISRPCDIGGTSASGGDSTCCPRSAHEYSRVDPLQFALTQGAFQLLVVTALVVQDLLMNVHVWIHCSLL